jgi:phosphoribosylaminoimidazole-succinocarboxamide synthase
MGSVKDLMVLKKPEGNNTGTGLFVFSDRYSVFDWGEMPNLILQKGKALCITGAYFFEKLEKIGIRTHYVGVVEDDKTKRLHELEGAVDKLKIKLVRVIKPKIRMNTYDYSEIQRQNTNFLIPLEIVYRNSLPAGSSVFKRLKEGTLKIEDIGLNKMPSPGEKLEKPILDVSTKFEATDRYISWGEAQKLVGLTDNEITEIKNLAMVVNNLITNETKRIGLENEDGKLEFAFDENRNLMLVDVLGTPDECRFTYSKIPVSKEIARIFYRNTEWYKDVERAKKTNKISWKQIVKSKPPPLPDKLEKLISMLYLAVCNELTNHKWFDTKRLEDILFELKDILNL